MRLMRPRCSSIWLILTLAVFFLFSCAKYPSDDEGPKRTTPLPSEPLAYTTDEDTVLSVRAEEGLLADIDGSSNTPVTLITTGTVATDQGGTLEIAADGSFIYTPAADFNGADTLTFSYADSADIIFEGSLAFTVNSINDLPVARDDRLATDEDTPKAVNVLENDSDIESATLQVSALEPCGHGQLAVAPDNTVTYTPEANYNGDDSCRYTVEDEDGGVAQATLSVTVASVEDPPVAMDDTIHILEEETLDFDVWANDFEPDGDPLGLVEFSQAATGSVSHREAGIFSYTPLHNFNGSDSFTYTIADNKGNQAMATVTIQVVAVADQPTIVNDTVTTAEDTLVNIPVLRNDSDPDGQSLSVEMISASDPPQHGTAVISANGQSIVYTPVHNFNGSDSFSYRAVTSDGRPGQATVSVTITPVNDDAVAVDDRAATTEETAVTIDVLANDSDVEGNPLTILEIDSPPANGTARVVENGERVRYTPNRDFPFDRPSDTDSFTYRVSDGIGSPDTGTVTVTVSNVNDDPTGVDDAASVAEDPDQALAIEVTTNDSDIDGDTVRVISVGTAQNGTVARLNNTTVTYLPNRDFFGDDRFTYTLGDGNGGTATATVRVTVTNVNDPPEAVDDTAVANEEQPSEINVTRNDQDPDSDTLTVSAVTQPANGTVAITNSYTVTYTSAENFNGTDTFSYTISDGNGGSDTATVTVTVAEVNDPPVAVDDTAATNEDTAVEIDVLANDMDTDTPLGQLRVEAITDGADNGTATVINNGLRVRYQPNPDFPLTAETGTDSFTYRVTDQAGGTATAMVTITVTNVNDDPTAQNDTETAQEEEATVFNLLTNDSDVDGDALTISAVSDPEHGTAVTSNGNTSVTYTSEADYVGSDSFTYTISDGQGGTATATVTVTVTNVNDAPVAADDTATVESPDVNSGAFVDITVLSNDSDVDNAPNELTIVTSDPSQGTATVESLAGVAYIHYEPDLSFLAGSDTFSYTVSDPGGLSDTASVTVTISSSSIGSGQPVVQSLLLAAAVSGEGGDAGGDDYTIDEDTTLVVSASQGLLASAAAGMRVTTTGSVETLFGGEADLGADGAFNYTPADNFSGLDSFVWQAQIPGRTASQRTHLTAVVVSALADAPSAVDDTYATGVGQSLAITSVRGVLANDYHVDGRAFSLVTRSAQLSTQGGSVDLAADGSLNYVPPAGFSGLDSFTYTIAGGGNRSASVRIAVGAGAVPWARSDGYSVAEDTVFNASAAAGVLANDNAGGETLSVTNAGSRSTTMGGVIVISANGGFTYTPPANFSGLDHWVYEADNGLQSAKGLVTFNVTPAEDAPLANADRYETPQGVAFGVATTNGVTANDVDADGDPLRVTSTGRWLTGSGALVEMTTEGSFSYSPAAGFSGFDTFRYTVGDGTGRTGQATVSVRVGTQE